MSSNEGAQGFSNCYVFKSRLQEYAQKAGLSTPIYHTIKEGPSHQPSFKSTVVVNDVRYDSLSGFHNHKAAEQSAAEVALMELANSGATNNTIYQPVYETGLCKNLLQEYAQKMNYAMPSYHTRKDENQGTDTLHSCIVEIGGISYIGGRAKTKKEAELKAARTALLAIQLRSGSTEKPSGNSIYTVLPSKRKETDSGISAQEKVLSTRPKKGRFYKKRPKRRAGGGSYPVQVGKMCNVDVNENDQAGTELNQTDTFSAQVTDSKSNGNEGEDTAVKCDLAPCGTVDSKDGHVTDLSFQQTQGGIVGA